MPLPFTMTIAGSMPLLIFIFLWLIQRENFSIFLGIRLLKISLFFYLVPVQLLYHVIPNSIYYFFQSEELSIDSPHPYRLTYNDEMIIPVDNYFLWIPRLITFFLALWLAGVIIFMILQFKNYLRLRASLRNFSTQLHSYHSKKAVEVLNIPYTCNPYSTGFIKSYIVISKELWESEYKIALYRHELCHIKNKDIWLRLLSLLAVCVHFYNPMVYLLFFFYHICSECICDAYAVEGLPLEKKKQYARLLVELAGKKNPLQSVLQNRFSASKLSLKERINFIMKDSNLKNKKKVSTFVITILSILFCTTTIWAYQPPKMTNWDPRILIGDGDMEVVSPEYAYESQYYIEEDLLDFSLSDTLMKVKNGVYSPFYSTDTPLRADCKHTFQIKEFYNHIPNNSGGCTITKYRVKICTKCNYIQSKTILNTISYDKCPHKIASYN